MLSLVIFISIIFATYAIVSVYWTFICFNNIYKSKKYMKGAARLITDKDSGYVCQQFLYHYQTEVRKYEFFCMINFVELSAGLFYYVQLILETYKHDSTNLRIEVENCTCNRNISVLIDYQIRTTANPLIITLRALGNSFEMITFGLGICLMKYLIIRIKKIDYKSNFKTYLKYILILSVTSIFVVVTSFFTYLIILSKCIFLPTITLSFILFMKQVKRFKQALLHRAIERLSQHGSNYIEMKQYTHFSYTMNCICLGMSFFIFSSYLTNTIRFIVCWLFFSACYFPFNLLPTLSLAEKEAMNIFQTLNHFGVLSDVSACIGAIAFTSPFIIITFCLWINHVYRYFKVGTAAQFHFKGTLQESLL